MWIPTSAAEVVERIVQPRASGSGVHGADADCSLSCHVSSVSPIKPKFLYCPLAVFILPSLNRKKEKKKTSLDCSFYFVLRLFLIICFSCNADPVQIFRNHFFLFPQCCHVKCHVGIVFIITFTRIGKYPSLVGSWGEGTELTTCLYKSSSLVGIDVCAFRTTVQYCMHDRNSYNMK